MKLMLGFLKSLFKTHPIAASVMAVLAMSMICWIANLLILFCKDPFQFSQIQQPGQVQQSYPYAYLFSALAQSLAALLGFLGIFVVYRLDRLHSRIVGMNSEGAKPYEKRREDTKNVGFALAILMMLAFTLSLLLLGRCEYLCLNPYLGAPYFAVVWGIPVIVVVIGICLVILGLVAWFAYLSLSGGD
ncbi:MAG: hypothetical protein HYS41_00235 [Candidatus Omnitrophica bacterium]|nr:hypothetical protein [Candidatus Omnitrophota bacterium]